MRLRDYQERSIRELGAEIQAGRRRPLLVAPTGSGKTVVFSEITRRAVEKGRRVLFAVHRQELVSQGSEKLAKNGVVHGVISAAHGGYRPDRCVQVCSIQTLAAREEYPEADVIVIDEAHRARAAQYQPLFRRYPRAVVVGLTATPIRLDGKGLGELFDALIVVAQPRELIEAGHLVDYEGFAYDIPDLSGVERRGGDYDANALHQRGTVLYGNIVRQWGEHARHLRTVVFAVNVAHSQELAEQFRGAGARFEHIDGTMGKVERQRIVSRIRSGALQGVVNVGILGEGFDVPELKCAVLARPTMSLAVCLQQIGRVMRPDGSGLLARIHDHAGNLPRHGFPDDDREWSLDGKARRSRAGAASVGTRTCERCRAVYRPTLPACPRCGHVNERQAREIEVDEEAEAIDLAELRARPPALDIPWQERFSAYMQLLEEAKRRGYKTSWASMRYQERYGIWPSRRWVEATPRDGRSGPDSARDRLPSSSVG